MQEFERGESMAVDLPVIEVWLMSSAKDKGLFQKIYEKGEPLPLGYLLGVVPPANVLAIHQTKKHESYCFETTASITADCSSENSARKNKWRYIQDVSKKLFNV